MGSSGIAERGRHTADAAGPGRRSQRYRRRLAIELRHRYVREDLDLAKATAHLGRRVRSIVLLVLLVAGGGIALAVWQAMKPITTALNDAATRIRDVEASTPARPAVSRTRAIAPAELATTTGGGWREISTAPPPDEWHAIEPVRTIAWATTIARAWAPDARLTRVDVARVSGAGVADATGSPNEAVGFRFVSPARIVDWETRAASDLKAEAAYELMMQLHGGKVAALVVNGRPPRREAPPRPPDSLPVGEVIGRAKKTGRFADLPFYAGYLIHLEREGWVWYLNGLARRESLPRVWARDGAVYPYR